MDKDTAKEIRTIYKKFRPIFPIKLYFIVKSFNNTRRTQGFGTLMPDYLNQPLELESIKHDLAFVLKLSEGRTYYYDYRDLELADHTKKFIKTISKPDEITTSKSFKFDEKTLYNFKENNRQK